MPNTIPDAVDTEKLIQAVVNWDNNPERQASMKKKLLHPEVFTELFPEAAFETRRKIQEYSWLSEDIITDTFQTEGHEPSVMKDTVIRKEIPTYQISFELMAMMRKVLSSEQFEQFQKKFAELTGLQDTSITIAIAGEKKETSDIQKLLQRAEQVLVVDHGWTGDKSMGTGKQKGREGKDEEIVLAGNWLHALPKEKREKAIAVSIDLLGQGKAQFAEGVTSFGQLDNAKAWSIIHSILQIVREGREITVLGHSMGGGMDIYLAGKDMLPEGSSIISVSPSYHEKNNPYDGNNWNNPKLFQPIRYALATYIKRLSPTVDKLLQRAPFLKSLVAKPISEALVREAFLKGIDRPDLLEGHVKRFLDKPEAAAITAIGSLRQPGISQEEWLKANQKQMILLFGFEGDQMCDQYKTAANLPSDKFFRENNQFPPCYYIFPKGHHYSFTEIQHQRELDDFFELQNQLRKNPVAFRLYQELQYSYYQEVHRGQKIFSQFLLTMMKDASIVQKLKDSLGFDKEDLIKEYLRKRSEYSSEQLSQVSHFSPGRMAEAILRDINLGQTLTGRGLVASKNLEQLEVILRTLERYTAFAVYNDENLQQKLRQENSQARRQLSRPARQQEIPAPAAGD